MVLVALLLLLVLDHVMPVIMAVIQLELPPLAMVYAPLADMVALARQLPLALAHVPPAGMALMLTGHTPRTSVMPLAQLDIMAVPLV